MTNKERAESILNGWLARSKRPSIEELPGMVTRIEQALDAAVNEATEGYRQRIGELENLLRRAANLLPPGYYSTLRFEIEGALEKKPNV